MKLLTKALAAALIAGGGWALAGSANAVSLGSASLSLRDASTPMVETVQYRRGWVGRRGVGVGLAVGAIAAGAVAVSTYPAYSYGYPAYGWLRRRGYAPAMAMALATLRRLPPMAMATTPRVTMAAAMPRLTTVGGFCAAGEPHLIDVASSSVA